MTGPSAEHETPIALARADPGLLVTLLADQFDLRMPEHTSGQAHSADIEAELDVPAVLLVYCPDPRIGDRYERLAADGISSVLRPFVVTPRNLPLVTDPARATQQPTLTVLSALAHRTDPRITEAFPALAAVMEAVGAQDFETYYDIVLTGLPPTIRTQWEDYMTATATGRRFLSDKLNRLYDDGIAKGKVEDILTILRMRGIEVPDQITARLTGADIAQLDEWFRRAVNATTLADVIED